jgi:hypothetical protein
MRLIAAEFNADRAMQLDQIRNAEVVRAAGVSRRGGGRRWDTF